MNKPAIAVTVFVFCSLTSSFLAAAKLHGKALHDRYCMRCHQTEVYTRKFKQVVNLGMLRSRVQTCYQVTGTKWTDKQIHSVVKYLNKAFYRFPAGR